MKNILDYIENIKQENEGPRITAQKPRNMADGGRIGYENGQLVQNTVDGSRPGYQGPKYSSSQGTPGVKYTAKEIKNISDDIANYPGISLKKVGDSYYFRFRIQKGDNKISESKVATKENLNLLKKRQKKFMKENYPNILSNADFENLRMQEANINLSAKDFAEVLNNKNKTTTQGYNWTKDTVQKLQGDLKLNSYIQPEGASGKLRSINDAKKIVRGFNPEELKRLNQIPDINLRNKAIRNKANSITGRTNYIKKTGTLQGITKNREGSLWKNFYESSKRNNRIVLGGTFNGKDLSFRKNWPKKADGTIDWFIKDKKTNKPAWQMLEFTDTQTPKGQTTFTYEGLQNQVDNTFGKGYFARSTNAYSSGRELYGKNIMFEGKMQPVGRVIARQKIINDFKKNNNGKMPTEKYINGRITTSIPTQVHHTKGIGNDPYSVQLVSREANQKLNAAELTYNAEIRKAKGDPTKIKTLNDNFKKTVNQISDTYGGIQYGVDGTTVGKAATGESMYTSAIKESGMNEKQQMNLLKKMGYRCRKAGGAGESVACYMDDVEKTRADMKSSDVTVRAKALTKQRNAQKVASQLPDIGKIFRKGLQMGVSGVTTPLKALGLTSGIGYAIEGLIEGGIYDYYRRKGYDHKQAMGETFTPGLIAGRPEGVPWYGGAEELREKELIGDPQQNPKVAQYVDALGEQDRIYSAIGAKEQAKEEAGLAETGFDATLLPADLDAASADVQDLARSGAYQRVDRTLAPESMASQAYNTAVERQQALDQRRRTEYLEKVEPAFLEREQKSFDTKRHRDKRYREMKEKFPGYSDEQIDDILAYYGREKPYNVTYDQISDIFKDQNKISYFADNFRMEKAGGGMVGIRKPSAIAPTGGPQSGGLPSLYNNVRKR